MQGVIIYTGAEQQKINQKKNIFFLKVLPPLALQPTQFMTIKKY